MPRLIERMALSVVAAATLVALAAPPAGAVAVPTPPGASPRPAAPTQMTMSGTGNGQGVVGFIANATNPFDPVTEGYPPSNPTTGFTPKNEGFAGIIFGTATDGSNTQLKLYCFDINTDTYPGINYALGTWDSSNVPNVNYVAQVLDNYYPKTDEPAALTNLNQKAAAVQAAIWFFSDRYALNTSDPLHATVAAIVAAVIAKGPALPPAPPSVNITPGTLSGTGAVLGPFTVTATGPATSASVTAVGADMFSNAAGTIPIAPGTTVPSGTQIWLRQTGQGAAVLQATARATVPQNNVYLYDGTNSGVHDAQRLILAQDATLTTTVSAKALFTETGSLIVRKTIAGPAAGKQGAVTINVRCGGVLVGDPFDIPAGSTGTTSKRYDNIPVGTRCTVTEIHDGHTSTVTVDVVGSGASTTITAQAQTVNISDTYSFVEPSVLVVRKSIQGPGAGQQGQVVIQPTCNGQVLDPFTIPVGATGEPSKSYEVAPGSVCTIVETTDGHTGTVTVTVVGSGQTVTVPGGGSVDAVITDTYQLVPGSLTVTKTIAGAAAGQQGPITIRVSCNVNGTDTPLPDFTIPAGAAAGSTSMTYPGIPAGSFCIATETATGDTSSVTTTITGDNGLPVKIPAAGSAARQITDTYDFLPGELIVRKSITGGDRLQGPITVHPVCNGTALPDFTIPAGAADGISEKTYDNIPTPATCTITETANGANAAVSVDVTGGGTVSVPAGGKVTSTVTDTFTQNPGSLVVSKTINGPGAGQQGPITITVTCVHDGTTTTLTPVLNIPAGATSVPPHTYTDIPAGSVCTVIEDPDGHTASVTLVKDGSGQQITIPPGGRATAELTDTYETGSLVVNKTITGDAAGSQGQVTIHTVCNGTPLTPDLVVPAGSDPGTYSQPYPNVIAGATCTVTETADGSSSTVTVTTTITGSPVTIDADGTGAVAVSDTYTFVPGSLTVTKTIAGPAAGQQGPVTIHIDCGADVLVTDMNIPAGATSAPPQTFNDLPAGTSCTVTETADGSTSTVGVTVDGSPQTVNVPAGGTATADITDTYAPAPGSLTVSKTIDGQAAGSQGEITIHAVCDGTALTPDIVIDAATAAGKTSHTYEDVPAGAACTVTETVDGSTSTVAVSVAGSPQDATVPAGGVATVDLFDTYTFVPGSLTVTKTISGASAGGQGPITIGVNCEGLPLPEFTIPAGATGPQSHTYPDIPAGLTCTVTEEADGSSSSIGVVTTGSPQDVKIGANADASADLTNTYGPVPGSLELHKTINGPSAGSQGPITISVTCGNATLPTWTIPAETAATTLTHTYTDIAAESACTVTETSDGATTTVIATVTGADQTVTVPAGITAVLGITDTFSPAPGALIIVKTLTGEGAGQQDSIGILVLCDGGIQAFALVIPAGHPAGPVPQVLNDVGGGSTCLIAEVIDGHTSDITVQATGARQSVTVPADGIANVDMTDQFNVAALTATSPPPEPVTLAATGPRAPIAPLIGLALATILAGAAITTAPRRRDT
ncbi:DUF5979 domain-containing protein [Jatrophihabitans sp. DSM 45814]